MDFEYNIRKSVVSNLKDLLKNYEENVDYLLVDCDKYVALLPFRYDILCHFKSKEKNLLLRHCTVRSETLFEKYFRARFLKDKELKVFFFQKGVFAKDIYKEEVNCLLPEFTCWLHNGKTREKYGELFYYFHDNINCNINVQDGKRYLNSYILAFPIINKWYSIIWETFERHKKEIKYTSQLNECQIMAINTL